MAKYMTSQRRMLMTFLSEHPDQQFSAKEIAEHLKDESICISSVYRNLSVLEKDGMITSVLRDGMRDKYYRCLFSEDCRSCIHYTCIKCGKSFHMIQQNAKSLIENAENDSKFTISAEKSVIYGTCKDCN
mgnify:FL=1